MNMTTVDALKDVYTELGGNATAVAGIQTDAEMIEALSALVGSTIELPAVDAEDNGKVLKVIDGAWNKGVDNTLPSVTTEDEGKTLLVDNTGAWSVEDVPKELPSVTSADEGDVLTVDSDGKWAKGETSGIHLIDVYTTVGDISQNTAGAISISFGTGKTMGDIYTEALQYGIENTALRVYGSGKSSEIIMRLSGFNESAIRYNYFFIDSDTNIYMHDLAVYKNSTETSKSPRFRKITT